MTEPALSAELQDPIDQAVRILRKGGLVAFPTETVYGLGADAMQPAAVAKIFAAKNRPRSHPLIVHLAAPDQLRDWVRTVPDHAKVLATKFWPGPLTMILEKHPRVPQLVTGGAASVGIRIPSHPVAQELLQRFGGGVAAPSANPFSRVSATLASHVRHDLGDRVDLVLEGDGCDIGIESTIVDLCQSPPVILRLGAITQQDLEQTLGFSVGRINRRSTTSPGQHPVHYSPRAETRIVATNQLAIQAAAAAAAGQRVVVLSRSPAPLKTVDFTWWQLPEDLAAVARQLYRRLHEIDAQGFELLLLDLPADEGIGAALRDRLTRAAGNSSVRST